MNAPLGISPLGRLHGFILPSVLLAVFVAQAAFAQPFDIGQTSRNYVDPARGNRSVPAEIFYPADTPGVDVPVAGSPGTAFPVITFGHGFLIPWDDYDYIWNGLVPEGYIVVMAKTEGGLLPNHLNFGLDLAFLVEALRGEGEDSGSIFHERVAETAAVMGHSMGGGASFLGAESCSTLTAITNLAAAETNPSAISAAGNIDVPAFIFAGSKDCVTPPANHQLPMYNALASACKTYINITGASHCQFAEYNFTCSLGEIGCSSPDITRGEQHALVLLHLIPWLDFNLKQDISAWNEFQDLLDAGSGITWLQDCVLTQVEGQKSEPLGIFREVELLGVRPNPFNPSTVVSFRLRSGKDVKLDVFDLSGRRVCSLYQGFTDAGLHELRWDGRDQGGKEVSSGIYLLRLSAEDETASCKVVVAR
jgi:hypothetical protein